MGFRIRYKVSNRALDEDRTICCWCYEITATDNDRFQEDEEWGLQLGFLDIPDDPYTSERRPYVPEPEELTECNDVSVDVRGGPHSSDSLAAALRWNPVGLVMPPGAHGKPRAG